MYIYDHCPQGVSVHVSLHACLCTSPCMFACVCMHVIVRLQICIQNVSGEEMFERMCSGSRNRRTVHAFACPAHADLHALLQ